MKKIQLGGHRYKNSPIRGYALVDDEDYEELNKYKWGAGKQKNTFYAQRSVYVGGKSALIYMHSQIAGTPKGFHTDHIDGNGLNNQRNNLRVCTASENAMNQGIRSNNTSGYKGVSWNKRDSRWEAHITVNKRKINLGTFSSPELASEAYIEARKKYHGDFAHKGEE